METVLLMSIHKPYTDDILDEKKLIELRTTKPKDMQFPFKAIIYETKNRGGCGMVVGEFICNKIQGTKLFSPKDKLTAKEILLRLKISDMSCVQIKDIEGYVKNHSTLYLYHVRNPKRYETPLRLEHFGIEHAPVAWRRITI